VDLSLNIVSELATQIVSSSSSCIKSSRQQPDPAGIHDRKRLQQLNSLTSRLTLHSAGELEEHDASIDALQLSYAPSNSASECVRSSWPH